MAHRPRLGVNRAQSANVETVAGAQRRASIKPDVGHAGDKRIFRKSCIFCGVVDNKNVILADCMRAERDFTGGFISLKTDLRLEPLPVVLNTRNQCNRYIKYLRGKPRDPVVGLFRHTVQDLVVAELGQAFGFLCWQGIVSHMLSCVIRFFECVPDCLFPIRFSSFKRHGPCLALASSC